MTASVNNDKRNGQEKIQGKNEERPAQILGPNTRTRLAAVDCSKQKHQEKIQEKNEII